MFQTAATQACSCHLQGTMCSMYQRSVCFRVLACAYPNQQTNITAVCYNRRRCGAVEYASYAAGSNLRTPSLETSLLSRHGDVRKASATHAYLHWSGMVIVVVGGAGAHKSRGNSHTNPPLSQPEPEFLLVPCPSRPLTRTPQHQLR